MNLCKSNFKDDNTITHQKDPEKNDQILMKDYQYLIKSIIFGI